MDCSEVQASHPVHQTAIVPSIVAGRDEPTRSSRLIERAEGKQFFLQLFRGCYNVNRPRSFVAVLGSAWLCLCLASSASAAAFAETSGARVAANPSGSVTLTVATVNNPQMIDMQKAVGEFTKETGIKVNFETLPENTLRQKVTTDVATGGGQFDLATVGTYEVPIWAKNKWIVGLKSSFDGMSGQERAEYDLGDVLPTVQKAISYKGELFALPFYGESSMLYYNKAEFAAKHLTMPEHPIWSRVAALV